MKDPYLVLNLNPNATDEEINLRYEELKKKYGQDRFLPGDAGNTAAKNLSELEDAYRLIKQTRENAEAKKEYGNDYGVIDKLIKEGKYDEAQRQLDAIMVRPAEWHYLQSIVYYKREWMTESRAQLQMAVNSEPWNEKYKTALDKLNIIMGSPKTDPYTIGQQQQNTNIPPQSDGQVCANTCSNCCLAYCITDCCCTMSQCC